MNCFLFNFYFILFYISSHLDPTDLGGQKCGVPRKFTSKKVIGGSVTKLGEYPWLGYMGNWDEDERVFRPFCGGSIVGPRTIITAAHCLDGPTTVEQFIVGWVNKIKDCVWEQGNHGSRKHILKFHFYMLWITSCHEGVMLDRNEIESKNINIKVE